MSGPVVGRRLVRRGVVGSTMDEMSALADAGAPEGTVVVAEYQEAGRGRSGRVWQAPAGTSLLLSVLIRPPVGMEVLATLPLAVGVAVADAIEEVAGSNMQVRLKWPNDLWVDQRKAGGILMVVRTTRDEAPRVIVGIGVNVNVDPQDLPPGATSLAAAAGNRLDREVLLHALLDRLDAVYRSWSKEGGAATVSAWRERAALVGEAVVIDVAHRRRAGIFQGIDDGGALLLKVEGGVERIVSGDLVRGPRRACGQLAANSSLKV